MHGLAVLREYGEDVAFREVEGETADVEPSCVAAMVFKLPSKVPIAVRRGEQIKMSVGMIYLL